MKSEFFICDEDHGQRLDSVIARLVPELSRSQASKLIKSGEILINNNTCKPSQSVEVDDKIEITLPETKESELKPYAFPLTVLYEDGDLMVLNKPAGLVIHPAAGHESDTLVNALIHRNNDFHIGFSSMRPGIVHRLDKDTSGALVVAKNNVSMAKLSDMFKERRIERKYLAVVWGEPKENSGRIESQLGRHPKDRKRFASVEKNGKEAATNYEMISTNGEMSLLNVRLETGRTHQIRVHMSELGHPIVGDDLYGGLKRINGMKSAKKRKSIKQMKRFALHAARLGFEHPTKGFSLEFDVGVPDELLFLTEGLL